CTNQTLLHEVDQAMSGLNLGSRSGAIYCRIYDKSREMERTGAAWLPELWGRRYDEQLPVTRVEFEFKRDGLREFVIDTPEQAFAKVGSLWAYATGRWASLRSPSSDETRSRWPVDRRWSAVQKASLAGGAIPAERISAGQRRGSLWNQLPATVGYLAAAAVQLGTTDARSTFDALIPLVDAYGQRTGVSFSERVRRKAALV
ncbi:MAG: hypothetical protein AAFY28_07030, partial [Actinomycetota bacterium]